MPHSMWLLAGGGSCSSTTSPRRLLLPLLAGLITGPGSSRGSFMPCADAMVVPARPSQSLTSKAIDDGHEGMGSSHDVFSSIEEGPQLHILSRFSSSRSIISSAAMVQIQALQWNAHGECFVRCKGPTDTHCDKAYPACRNGARTFLANTLRNSASLDFAGLEQFNDENFSNASGVDLERWSNVTHTCGGSSGYGVYPFDLATLIFDKQRWAPIGATRGGCFERVEAAAEPNYRAFLVQAFQRISTEERVVVAVSHHPHTLDYKLKIPALASAAAAVRAEAAAERMLLIADTNAESPTVPFGMSSKSLMDDIYPDVGDVASTDLLNTCCAWQYVHTYDRVVAAHFPLGASMATSLPFSDAHPPFAALHMHDPVLATLTYSEQLRKTSDSKSAAIGSNTHTGIAALVAMACVLELSLML
eukprot:TRINITY_DN36980_c0_g1_i1.p1 TRINITY_DN36980_c0_g1~~TRINITY_DN36980_c0_g1_i1.p1  ORF type:complete len:418 (+),score=63.94 TRINITY_DN36980_c0_g1_i1:137-1390(+)